MIVRREILRELTLSSRFPTGNDFLTPSSFFLTKLSVDLTPELWLVKVSSSILPRRTIKDEMTD